MINCEVAYHSSEGFPQKHELTADCWCNPIVEIVPANYTPSLFESTEVVETTCDTENPETCEACQ